MEEGAPIQVIIKDKDILEEGVPSFAAACRRRQSSAITPCCPPFVQAGYGYRIFKRLCGRTDEL